MASDRYSRQILFTGIGRQGQERLTNSRVSVIGCGALGSMHAEMLARAGVGRLRLIDRDFIEESNLQRQIMFEERDVAERLPKAVAAAARISRINSEVAAEPVVADVNYMNVEELIGDADVVLDGTDNFEVRYLINDAAVKLNKPWVYGAAVGAYGVQMTIRPHLTPCLRCVFPEAPSPGNAPTCDTAGVILPVIATVSAWQVAEALKILTGQFDKLHGTLMQFDLWHNQLRQIRLDNYRQPDEDDPCRTCRQGLYDFLTPRGGQFVMTLCGRNAVQIAPSARMQVDFNALAEQLRGSGEVSYNRFLLKLVLKGAAGDYEITVFPDARSIIKGTDDPNIARSLYARYIGS
ncbi:MAG TPA: ThiF family adenylyltransferase [Blastocatellia bacterium]|nr:ThiF family adenylyltransferase [Blastocatellia bacterium]